MYSNVTTECLEESVAKDMGEVEISASVILSALTVREYVRLVGVLLLLALVIWLVDRFLIRPWVDSVTRQSRDEMVERDDGQESAEKSEDDLR